MDVLFCLDCSGSGEDEVFGGECKGCDGSGDALCDARFCREKAVGFDEDGRALCEDHLFDWMEKMTDGARP